MAEKTDGSSTYRIFLLTVWPEDEDNWPDTETWRFRLEEPARGRRYGCVGVSALVARLIGAVEDDAESLDGAP